MRTFAFVLAVLMALPLFAGEPAALQKDALQLERTVSGDIEIGPDGGVHDYTLDDELTPALAAALDKSIRGWHFQPITADGRPVIAKSSMQIKLQLIPHGDNFTFKVTNVYFGAPDRYGRMRPPRYPTSARMVGLGAKVSLVLKLDGEGKVEDIHVEQVSLDHRTRSETQAKRWRKVFAKASVRVADEWTFNPATFIDGEPVESLIRVPVVYKVTSDGRSDTDSWQTFVPGPYTPSPWAEPDDQAQARIAQLQNGETQALDSRFHLLGGVVGSTL